VPLARSGGGGRPSGAWQAGGRRPGGAGREAGGGGRPDGEEGGWWMMRIKGEGREITGNKGRRKINKKNKK